MKNSNSFNNSKSENIILENDLRVSLLSYTAGSSVISAVAKKVCGFSDIEKMMLSQKPEEVIKSVKDSIVRDYETVSPLSHASFTFAIEGIPESLIYQLKKYGTISYNPVSQRCVEMNGRFGYSLPNKIKEDSHTIELAKKAMESLYKYYCDITRTIIESDVLEFAEDEGINDEFEDFETIENIVKSNYREKYYNIIRNAKEATKYLLPDACESRIICTMNLKNIVDLLNSEFGRKGEASYFNLSTKILNEIKRVDPTLSKNLKELTKYRK